MLAFCCFFRIFLLSNDPIRSETIRLLVREGRHLGRLIFALKAGSSRSQVLCATQTWAQQYLSAYQPYVSNSTYTSFLVFFCVAPVVQLLSFDTKLRRRSLHGVNRTLYVPALAPHCVGVPPKRLYPVSSLPTLLLHCWTPQPLGPS